MALVRSKRSNRTGSSPKKRQKVAPPKQNIVLYFHSSTMTVALTIYILTLGRKQKLSTRLEVNTFFFSEHYRFETKMKILGIN